MTDLDGLQNVTFIGGSIDMYGMNNLSSLQGLSSVTSINGFIKIEVMFNLTSLNGLENIDHTTITNLTITSCNQLTTCAMTSICEYLDEGGTSDIHSNAIGCNSPAEVDAVCPNPEIDVLGGDGPVSITDGDNTPDMADGTAFNDTPLPNTSTNVLSIKNVGGLPLTVTSITVNSEVADVFELGTVSQTLPYNLPVDQTMTFEVDFMPNGVGTFIGDVEIVSNDLDENPFNFDLEGNGTDNDPNGNVIFLTQAQVDAFVNSFPNTTSIVGYLQIGPNSGTSDISNISGLADLETIGGHLLIQNNPSLNNLNGLGDLQSVATYLTIDHNSNLGNIATLNSLTSLGSDLTVTDNDDLTNLNGLGNIASILGDLTIQYNNILSACEIECVCEFIAAGTATISNNATGCNNQTQVEFECTYCPTGQNVLVSGTGCTAGAYPVDGIYEYAGMANDKSYYEHSNGIVFIVWATGINPPAWVIIYSSNNTGEIQYINTAGTLTPPTENWVNAGNFCVGLPVPTLCGDVTVIASWTASSNGDWNTGSNWSNNQSPNATTMVTIPSNVTVTISNAAQAQSITLSNGADLVVNSPLTLSNNQSVSLSNGSEVSGIGTINGNLIHNNGNVGPGNSPGKLTVNGDYTLGSGILDIEINGTTVETQYDQLDVSGNASINASNSLLNLTFGYNPAVNDFYDILTANTVSGSFNTSNVTFSGGDVTAVSISYPGGNKVRVTVAAMLPVELLTFNATPSDKTVLLRWQTASETNNAGFEVQRSHDGKSWEALAFVPGQGTSLETNNYSHTDQQPLPSVSYYRLQQLDFDGKISFSPVVSVDMRDLDAQVNVFPNPFSKSLHLQFPDHTEGYWQTRLLDVTGKSHWSGTFIGGLQIIELPELQAGVYWLELENEGQKMQVRVVKY